MVTLYSSEYKNDKNKDFQGLEDGSRIGGPQVHLNPQIQLGKYQIILHTPETDLKTNRTKLHN